jgi:hypothetical protein
VSDDTINCLVCRDRVERYVIVPIPHLALWPAKICLPCVDAIRRMAAAVEQANYVPGGGEHS